MDGTILTPSDPAILLLNEIDILLAQMRLMELYLKQAQATAANEAARIHRQHQAELDLLRAALSEKERAAHHRAANPEPLENFAARIRQLEVSLDSKQSLLDTRDDDLAAARAELGALHRQITDLETACQQFEHDQRNLRQQQLDAQQLEQELRAQLAQLQMQLAETPAGQRHADNQIENDRNEIAALRNEILELQAGRQRAEADEANELAQSRAQFGAEIARLQTSLVTHEQERAVSENSLKSELGRLRRELEEKQQQIESRDGALQEAQSEIAGLRQRASELESAQRQAASDQAALENEIAELHHQLAVKERELTQRYEALSGVEIALHGRIQGLQQELARRDRELADRRAELAAHHNADELNDQLGAKINELQLQLAQKQLLVDSRSAEIGDLKDHQSRLLTQLADVESAQRQSTDLLQETEQSRAAHQNEIAARTEAHRTELRRLESELAQKRGALAGLEQAQRQEIASLRRQLSEKSAARDSSSGEVSSATVNLTTQAHERRWRGGFAAKRRWKV